MNRFRLPRIYKPVSFGFVFQTSILLIIFALLSEFAWAGSMKCGTYLISDGSKPGPSKAQVRRKCGTPYSESGNRWVYYKGRSVYRLRFSDVSGLVSLKREIER